MLPNDEICSSALMLRIRKASWSLGRAHLNLMESAVRARGGCFLGQTSSDRTAFKSNQTKNVGLGSWSMQLETLDEKQHRLVTLILSFLSIWQEWRRAVCGRETAEHTKPEIWKQLRNSTERKWEPTRLRYNPGKNTTELYAELNAYWRFIIY